MDTKNILAVALENVIITFIIKKAQKEENLIKF